MSLKKKIVYIDMDDTLASFIGDERHEEAVPLEPLHQDYKQMHLPGFFRRLKPIPGGVEGVKKLIQSNLFEIYICSVPLHTSPHSYSEKVEWIHEFLPELSNRIILIQDKTLLKGNYLVDDSLLWKEKWEQDPERKFIHFNPRRKAETQWQKITDELIERYKPVKRSLPSPDNDFVA